jgi:hypothetical protein
LTGGLAAADATEEPSATTAATATTAVRAKCADADDLATAAKVLPNMTTPDL